MNPATNSDVAELATVLADDHFLGQQLREDLSECITEAAYSADNNESVDPEGIELDPAQEQALVNAAVEGALDALEDLDESHI